MCENKKIDEILAMKTIKNIIAALKLKKNCLKKLKSFFTAV